jgi:hypothetical protein
VQRLRALVHAEARQPMASHTRVWQKQAAAEFLLEGEGRVKPRLVAAMAAVGIEQSRKYQDTHRYRSAVLPVFMLHSRTQPNQSGRSFRDLKSGS